MTFLYFVLIALIFTTSAIAAPRSLLVVNSLGETLDAVNLEESTVSLNIDVLGLFPNDIVVSGNHGVEINSGSNDLYFYSLSNLQQVGTCFLGNGRNPYNADFLNSETLYVTNLVSSTISKIAVTPRTVIDEFSVGDAVDTDSPQGIVIRNRRAYVCLTSFNALFEYDAGKLEVWDLDADTLIKRVLVGVNPQVARFGYDGKLYILCTGNYADIAGRIFKFDPVTLSLMDSLDVGGTPGGIAITKKGIAFLSAGGWPPPLKFDAKGKSFDANRETNLRFANGLVFTVNLNTFSVNHGPTNPLSVDWGVSNILTISDSTVMTCNFADDTITEIDSTGNILARFNVGDGPLALAKVPACFAIKGDADYSGLVNISDAVHLIAYIFAGGPAPVVIGGGDMNCDGDVNISDAVAVIAYIFAGGAGPCGCAD